MSVITISRQLGSLGTEIAQAVAVDLHYQLVDKERIGEALAVCGLPQREVERLDEKSPPFWDSWSSDRKRFFHYLQMTVYDFAHQNNVVIVGRGGQILLKDLPGVLHVRVVAPFEVRVRRIMGKGGMDEKQAVRRLKRSDQDSAGFIRAFFNMGWEDPNLYDLVINTQKLSPDTGVKMILESVQSAEIKEGEVQGAEKLADLVLHQKVESAIMRIVGLGSVDMNIRVEEGVVTLEGTVTSGVNKENCERAAASIEGVKKVNNLLSVAQYYRYSA